MNLRKNLRNQFVGGCWNDAEIENAINKALDSEVISSGWRWSVGTPGSIHYTNGFAPTKEEAEEDQAVSFARMVARNPACGTFETRLEPETPGQRFTRVARRVSEILNVEGRATA